jgi:hypothetical protein
MRILTLISVLLCLAACGGPPVMETISESKVAPNAEQSLQNKVVRVLYHGSDESKLALREKERVETFLRQKGLIVVPEGKPFEFLIAVIPEISVDEVKYTYSSPTWGITGVQENVYSGQVSSTYGITGSETMVGSKQLRSAVVVVWIHDMKTKKKIAEFSGVGSVRTDLCGDEFLASQFFSYLMADLPVLRERTYKEDKHELHELVCGSYSYNNL